MTQETKTKLCKEDNVKVPCEIYSRVVGYLRPVRNWNKGKQQEYQDRKVYNLPIQNG
jgi:ribonucleoside-triphosphate reductase